MFLFTTQAVIALTGIQHFYKSQFKLYIGSRPNKNCDSQEKVVYKYKLKFNLVHGNKIRVVLQIFKATCTGTWFIAISILGKL